MTVSTMEPIVLAQKGRSYQNSITVCLGVKKIIFTFILNVFHRQTYLMISLILF